MKRSTQSFAILSLHKRALGIVAGPFWHQPANAVLCVLKVLCRSHAMHDIGSAAMSMLRCPITARLVQLCRSIL